MSKSAAVVTKKVSMKGVHSGLARAIARLNKIKDPEAKKMLSDLKTIKASLRCGQTMVFKFPSH